MVAWFGLNIFYCAERERERERGRERETYTKGVNTSSNNLIACTNFLGSEYFTKK